MKIKYRVAAGLIIFFVVSTAFVQSFSLSKSVEQGKELYTTYCQNCHMMDGKGTPGVFPPVAKTDYLKKPAKLWIDLVLKGQTGEVTVNGVSYNGQMLPLSYLSDEQVADVLNYTRNSWGNKASAITPAMVAKARQ